MNLSKAAIRAFNVAEYDTALVDDVEFYLAETPQQKSNGLSGLSELDKAGMIFVYDTDNTAPFHMGGMAFDLNVAFYDSDGKLLKQKTYVAGYEGPIFSPFPYRYVVETPANSFDPENFDISKMKKKKRKVPEPYAARDFNTDKRKKLAKEGKAMPDGSFPIVNAEDLRNAIKLAGKAKNPAAARRHIKSRAKALGLTNLIPDSWSNSSAAFTPFPPKAPYNHEKRMQLAKEGKALPDGSFPIVTTQDLKDAIILVDRGKDPKAAKAHIIKRAEAMDKTNLLPKGWVSG